MGNARASRATALAVALVTASTAWAAGPAATGAAPATGRAATALSAAESTSPALTSLTPGRRDLFTRSSTGTLLHQYLLPGGSWRRVLDRGGALRSQPAAVSWAPGRLDVFARGTDDRLWHRYNAAGTWSPWRSLGGTLTSAPAAVSWAKGRLDVFARGADNALHQRSYAAGAWSGWRRIGGTLSSSPAAASWGPGRIDVVARGAGNALLHTSYVSGTGWSGWRRIAGTITAQPAIVAPTAGRLDVVMRGPQQRLGIKSFQTGAGWGAWSSLGAEAVTSGPGAAAIDGEVVVTAKRANGSYYQCRRASRTTSWSGWSAADQYLPFRRLATWVDVLDYPSLDPAVAVPDMKARGVRTLFLSTARFNSAHDFFDEAEMGEWLDRAHAAGIKVVGWYVPAYGDLARDVRRTVAVGGYVSPGGQRFDAVGVDIERFGTSGEVDRATFNASVVPHLRQVRAQTTAVLGAIVPSPYATDRGNNWEGFPWSGIGPNSEVVVPMALWSFRAGYSPAQVYSWVKDQLDRTQALTGRRVHVEGGVIGEGSTPVTTDRVQAFVDAVRDGGAVGGSQYDYATMNDPDEPVGLWPVLAGLNTP